MAYSKINLEKNPVIMRFSALFIWAALSLSGCANHQSLALADKDKVWFVELQSNVKFRQRVYGKGTAFELLVFKTGERGVIFNETVQATTGGVSTGVAGPVLLGPPSQQKYGLMINKNGCSTGDWFIRDSLGSEFLVSFTKVKTEGIVEDMPWSPKSICFVSAD